MEDAQVGLDTHANLNRDDFEAEVNYEKEIPCNGNGLAAEVNNVDKETKNLENELLEDLDSYMDDINDRLLISRMVNDSVIKGMVNAVEQEAAERIAAKELEVSHLMREREVKVDKVEYLVLLTKENELKNLKSGRPFDQSFVSMGHDEMRDSLRSLKIAANKQFQKLKKEIDNARGCAPMKRISSVSELVGLGGILQEKECESWARVDKMLTNLKDTVESMWGRMDEVLQLSKTSSFAEWKLELEFQGEIEAMVMQSVIRSLQEEFEEKLWDQNAKFSGIPSLGWHEKFDEVCNLRTELDAVFRLLSAPETGQLNSHGSHDIDSNSHHKSVSASSPSVWGNGKLEDRKIDMPENFETAQLKHMSKDGLVNYFNTMITKMKRDHESIVQKQTEEFFCLKRDYLNLKELSHRKDTKEFDTIIRKIPDVIMTLNKIFREDENMPALIDDAKSVVNLKNRMGSLLSENRQLRDALSDKKNELKHLFSLVSYAEEKMMQHALSEANMQKLVAHLSSTIEDIHIEDAIKDDMYKCFLMELSGQLRCVTKESEMEFQIEKEMYDIILREAVVSAGNMNNFCVEDSEIEALIEQEICGLICREVTKDADDKLMELNSRYLTESDKRIKLERKSIEELSRLWVIAQEKERFRQEIIELEALLQEKEKVAGDLIASLTKERAELRERLELLSDDLNIVREQESQHRAVASERSKEIEVVKDKLVDAFQKIEEDKVEVCKLHNMLEEKTKELKKDGEQRELLLSQSIERHNNLLAEAKEKELKQQQQQMEVIAFNVHELSKFLANFESLVAGIIKMNVLRLEDLYSQVQFVTKRANSLRKTGLLYKQRLEWRSADLQKAEAEVDLLGDEVDTLLGLLEKIYIALDHYSPILKHYPGVMEILQLVRRELNGDSSKSGRSSNMREREGISSEHHNYVEKETSLARSRADTKI